MDTEAPALATTAIDPVIVDAYANDLNGAPNWAALAASGLPWAGAIIKANEGLSYAPGWFVDNWRTLRQVALAHADRTGRTWFRSAYTYWRADADPVAQGSLYLSMVEAGGGWLRGDLWSVIDVERGDNPGVTKNQVEDGVSSLAEWLANRTGRAPILYAGSLLRDLGITSHMNCGMLWTAAYGSVLPPSYYESIGWTRDRLWGWQYRGTSGNTGVPPGYPTTSPIGRLDLTAMVINDAIVTPVNGCNIAPLEWTQAQTGGLI